MYKDNRGHRGINIAKMLIDTSELLFIGTMEMIAFYDFQSFNSIGV